MPDAGVALHSVAQQKTESLLLIGRRALLGLSHEFDCFNSPNVSARVPLERVQAKRAAQRDHPFAMFDSREPITAGNHFFADGTLNRGAVYVAGVEIHTSFILFSVFSKTLWGPPRDEAGVNAT
jgi:hypothetical protein